MDRLRFEEFEPIGEVWVDSGQVMLVDPCYVLGSHGDLVEETYQDVLDAYDPLKEDERVVQPWGTGLGLVVGTMWGDGGYTVYARTDEHGRNRQILIDFEQIEDVEDDEDEFYDE